MGFRLIFFPVVWVLEKISELISKRKAVDQYIGTQFTHEEFHNLLQSESSSHSLEEHEKKMLVGLFRFKEAEIKEIYVPRVKITAIEENKDLEELKQIIIDSGYSRIPVYRGTIDEIVGIIYVITLSPPLVLLLFPLEFRLDILCSASLDSRVRLLSARWRLLPLRLPLLYFLCLIGFCFQFPAIYF